MKMKSPFGGIVLNVAFRILVPFTMIYGVYVLCFGEYSPGGGFQAGALLAVGILLARLILGADTKFNVSGERAVILAGLGTSIYAAVGWVTMLNGGRFFVFGFISVAVVPVQ